MEIMTIVLFIGIGILAIIVLCAIGWYNVVPPSEAHVVVTPTTKFVVSSDSKLTGTTKRSYFSIPLIRQIRVLDITVKDLDITHETFEKNQARYNVRSSMKYRITDPQTAAETFTNEKELEDMLKGVLQSSVRAVTVKYDVNDTRANKLQMEDNIREQIEGDLNAWGLQLVNFQLVDFQDTNDSKIISNISKRREIEIESTTREVNAEKIKQATVKEAEALQISKTREIERDEAIAKREQDKAKNVSELQKSAQEKAFEVIRVQTIKQAEIDKDQAIILATQQKETEAINKEKKRLEGEGDRIKQEEQAKGLASTIRENGLAEAEAKTKLSEALKKFDQVAIQALTAEKIIDMQKSVGIETAKALSQADVKAFIGDGGKEGFDLGKVITSLSVSNEGTAQAVLNKIARPNDLGLSQLDLQTALSKKK